MKREAPDVELVVLAIVAAAPFYFNAALSLLPVALFHAALGAILAARMRRADATLPRGVLRILAIGYLLFYFVDGVAVSRSLIRATGHLLFFIAFYQAVDRDAGRNRVQRLLVIFLIGIASIATSTHIAIVAFVAGFVALLLRQLMALSREESARVAGLEEEPLPATRSVGVYMLLLVAAAAAFFPLLPRVRNPFVRGAGFTAPGAATGFSDAIDFSSNREVTPDPRVVARVTISPAAAAEFTPIRLRGGHYDRYLGGRWTSRAVRTAQHYAAGVDAFTIGQPAGPTGTVGIRQTRTTGQNQRIYLPVGTWQVRGPSELVEGPNQGAYFIPGPGEALVDFETSVSRDVAPLRAPRRLPSYDVPPAIRELADSIAGTATTARQNAAAIESHLSSRFAYVPTSESIGRLLTTEQFLLTERRGRCEHFATGMVLLLAARGVPARVAGGYYGGEYNPLGGYWVIRQRDAHAWVEVWEGSRWTTWDPTPSDQRPGSGTPNYVAAYLSAVSESINFFWDRYILTFGLSDQVNLILSGFYSARDVFTRYLSALAGIRAAGILALSTWLPMLILTALIVAIALRWKRRSSLFDLLAKRLVRLGLSISPSMTGNEVIALVRGTRPAIAPFVERIVSLYERDRFSSHPLTREEKVEARVTLKQVG